MFIRSYLGLCKKAITSCNLRLVTQLSVVFTCLCMLVSFSLHRQYHARPVFTALSVDQYIRLVRRGVSKTPTIRG